MGGGAALHCIEPAKRFTAGCVGAEPVHRLGGERDEPTVAERSRGPVDEPRRSMVTAVPNAAGNRLAHRARGIASARRRRDSPMRDAIAASGTDPLDRHVRARHRRRLQRVGFGRSDDDPRRRLVEEVDVDAARTSKPHSTKRLPSRRRTARAAVGDVVDTDHQRRRRRARARRRAPSRAPRGRHGRTDARDACTLASTRGAGRSPIEVVDEAEHADDRRRVDVVARGLVVEADVAADDRDAERPARLGHAVDRLGELPHHLGMLGVAEVEAVDERERPRARRRRGSQPPRRRPARCRAAGRRRTSDGCRRW